MPDCPQSGFTGDEHGCYNPTLSCALGGIDELRRAAAPSHFLAAVTTSPTPERFWRFARSVGRRLQSHFAYRAPTEPRSQCSFRRPRGCERHSRLHVRRGVPGNAGLTRWPARFDPNAIFYDTGKSWIDVLTNPPSGDVVYILAHQFIAAGLNLAELPPSYGPKRSERPGRSSREISSLSALIRISRAPSSRSWLRFSKALMTAREAWPPAVERNVSDRRVGLRAEVNE